MGFKAVYETLREIFPQLDARILKAVAIEHSKDVDAAINDVLVEVIPYLCDKIISPSPAPKDSSPGVLLDNGDGKDKENKISNHEQFVIRADHGPSVQRFISFDDSYDKYYVPNSDKAPVSGALDESQSEVLNLYDANDGNEKFYTSVESAEFAPIINSQEYSGEVLNYMPPAKSNDVFPENGEIDAHAIPPVNNESCEKFYSVTFGDADIKVGAEQPITLVNMTNLVRENGIGGSPNEEHASLISTAMDNSDVINCERIYEVEPCVYSVLQRVYNPANLMIPPASRNPDPVSSEFHPVTEFDGEKPWHSSPDLSSKLDCSITTDSEEPLICNSLETWSDRLCNVDFLEEMIEAAKNNKKILASAMETVTNKMKEVTMREKAVEQAQKEAANDGGMDVMLKVEELKHMLARAMEANNMYAGEVHGEKAILATEARELQSRLLNLSDERDKYLQILDEMRQSIEMRLATAEEVRIAAEQEKMQKEEYARKALVEQEALMEKVVEESRMLQQEAEENSKLQEFIMNRGRIVDTLQGEISVICQDVKLLKEKFDERVPFSRSLSSSQTSCILASSASSQKRTVSDSVHSDSTAKVASPDSCAEQEGSFYNSNKRIPWSIIDGSSIDHRFYLEKAANEYKAPLGDGWDVLDAVSGSVSNCLLNAA